MKLPLRKLAHARSGDKGDGSNVGLIAQSAEAWTIIQEQVTAPAVKAHFASICRGSVLRYEIPTLRALNFILKDSLGGGGTESLKTDAQGKAHGQLLLYMEVEVPDDSPIHGVESEGSQGT